MNRKSKIIVSVVGITIVLLALLSITYAYYLTRIQGNTNTNSISVTTADLKLVYGDGNGLVTASDIMPGTTITKMFTVTNSGQSKVNGYLVVLEEVTNELTRKDDLVYTLDCKLNDATSCGGITETIYPSESDVAVIYSNDIESGITHYYTLTVTYINLESVDQSDDMGKTFSGRVNIKDANSVNPYNTGDSETNESLLLYNLIESARTNKNGTVFSSVPLSQPGIESIKQEKAEYELTDGTVTEYVGFYETSLEEFYYDGDWSGWTCVDESECSGGWIGGLIGYDLKDTNGYILGTFVLTNQNGEIYMTRQKTKVVKPAFVEKVLGITNDDNGVSYYYRGYVEDNFVNYAGMCWRVVRILGNGGIKLILDDANTTCNDTETETTSITYTGNYKVTASSYGTTEKETLYNEYNEIIGEVSYLDYFADNGLNKTFNTWLSNSLIDVEDLVKNKWCLDNQTDVYEGYFDYVVGNKTSFDSFVRNNAQGGAYSKALYESYLRLKSGISGNPLSINVNNICGEGKESFESYIGTLTADEVIFSGALMDDKIESYLSVNDVYGDEAMGIKAGLWWTLTPSYSSTSTEELTNSNQSVFVAGKNICGNSSSCGTYYYELVGRPSIVLKSDTTFEIGGEGTIENPYVIN